MMKMNRGESGEGRLFQKRPSVATKRKREKPRVLASGGRGLEARHVILWMVRHLCETLRNMQKMA